MEISVVIEWVERLAGLGADAAVSAPATTSELEAGLVAAARELDAWVEARRSAIVTQLARVDAFAESTIAAASKTSIGRATNVTERAGTLTATPTLAEALDDGAVTAGHVDAVTRAGKQLDEQQRAELFDRIESLVDVARAATVDAFAKRVKLEARRIEASDGMDRYERHRRSTRLSTWTDDDGMWNLRGRFDPLTGTVADLDTELDPGELSPSHVRWPIPVEVPTRVLAELMGDPSSDVVGVVVCNGVVLHAPGTLDQGRTNRIANRARRRALRAASSTCGVPITLGPNRELTLTLPDGQIMTTGPPTIRAA